MEEFVATVDILTKDVDTLEVEKKQQHITDCTGHLKDFVSKNIKEFTFYDRGYPLLVKQEFISNIIFCLENFKGEIFLGNVDLLCWCLEAVRIVSREKKGLGNLHKPKGLSLLLMYAGFEEEPNTVYDGFEVKDVVTVKSYATKCLLNAVYRNKSVCKQVTESNGVKGMMKELDRTNVDDLSQQGFEKVKYTLQILYLMCVGQIGYAEAIHDVDIVVLSHLLQDYANVFMFSCVEENNSDDDDDEIGHVVELLMEILNFLYLATEKWGRFYNQNQHQDSSISASAKELEALKIIFICNRKLANMFCKPENKEFNLRYNFNVKHPLLSKIMNLLFNVPAGLGCLLASPLENLLSSDTTSSLEYSISYTFIDIVLEYMYTWAKTGDVKLMQEHIVAPMSTVNSLCRVDPRVRKYLYAKILPNVRDKTKRPEQLDNYRGHFTKLMTCHLDILRECVTTFLKILCKNNPSRLIAHTGYGNAAGAVTGLLPSMTKSVYEEFSSDEDLTDNEDDKETHDTIHKDLPVDAADTDKVKQPSEQKHPSKDIHVTTNNSSSSSNSSKSSENVKEKSKKAGFVYNPVTGSYTLPKKDMFAGMSEEEKEIEAEKLGRLIQKLNEQGIITTKMKDEHGNEKNFHIPPELFQK